MAGAISPPKAKADVLSAPAPAKLFLAEFKSPTSVHALPFQDSTISFIVVYGAFPPIARADVVVPAPPTSSLAVFISPTSVQDVPSYCSTKSV